MLVAYEITIAKKGSWRTALGDSYVIDDSKLNDYVETYNPAQYRAPLIFRHDTHGRSDVELSASKFSFGFPQKLKRVGDEVRAVFSRISPTVKSWIADGNVIALSPSFYRPDSPANPTPGRNSLRHIALLGSEPPAIAGMPLELSSAELGGIADDASCVNFVAQVHSESGHLDFAMGIGGTLPGLFQRLREYLITEKGADEAEKVLPAEMLSRLTDDSYFDPTQWQWGEIEAMRRQVNALEETVELLLKKGLSDKGGTYEFSREGTGMKENEQERNPKEAELELELARVRTELAGQRRKAAADFVQQQVERGAILPGQAQDTTELLLALEQHPVDLSAGDATKQPAETFRELLAGMKPQITYGEVAKGEGAASSDSYDFQQAPGYDVDPTKKDLHRKALAYQRQHPDVDIVTAYKAVGGE